MVALHTGRALLFRSEVTLETSSGWNSLTPFCGAAADSSL
jgi:hypothetical protein